MEYLTAFVGGRSGVAAVTACLRRLKRAPGLALALSIALIGPAGLAHAEEETIIEEMVVVGSRIQKPDYAYSNPVQSVSAAELQQSGTTNVSDYLKTLPALTGTYDSNNGVATGTSFIGSTGLSLLNLRNLGTDRTLVLVNGRRHVSALEGSQSVDVDTIPNALIDRIEILTGGASAIYGADGVSGVVNFVTKTDFEGFDLSVQGGRSSNKEPQRSRFSATFGQNFSEGRGNVAVAVEHTREDRLKGTDRKFAAGGERQIFVDNPFDFDDDPTVPDIIPLGDVRYYDSSRNGAIDVDGDFVQDFDGDDTPFDFGTIPYIPPFFQQGGDGTPVDDYIGDLLPETRRTNANLLLNYEFNEAARVYGEFKYAKNDSYSESQPTFDFYLIVEPDNPFIPPNIGAALDNPFGFDFASVPWDIVFGLPPGQPPSLVDGNDVFIVGRDHFDLGVRYEDIERETFRSVIGIEGDFGQGFFYDVSYVYGKTDVKNESNSRYNDRLAAALDAVVDPATGETVCRSNLDPSAEPYNVFWQQLIVGSWNEWEPQAGTWAGSFQPGAGSGCVPFNPFGEGSPSQASIDWISTTSEVNSELEQHVVTGILGGSSEQWFSLPGGPIQFVMGYEWREESSKAVWDEKDQNGLTFGNVIENSSGDYDVSEFFIEADLPLISGKPFAELLSVDGAWRTSDYSTIGTATTWKAGMVWQPIEDITIRGTIAEATRAPNIGELFDPGGQTFRFITDPCDIDELGEGTAFRQANCAEILTALGVDPTTFTDPNSASIAGTVRGNPDLSEEVAETDTIGIVLRPRFIPNLTLSVDWYDIEIKDAINTALPQTAAEQCVDLQTIDNPFCALIDRSATNNGGIVNFRQQPVNVANFTTEGYDFRVEYLLDPAEFGANRNFGQFNFSLIGNKLEDLTFINLPDAAPDEDLGEPDAPEWQLKFDLVWTRGPLTINYAFDYFNETDRFTTGSVLEELEDDEADDKYLKYDAKFEQHIRASYDFPQGFSLYGGINNFTNEKPDIGSTFYPYSAVGRFFFLGFQYTR